MKILVNGASITAMANSWAYQLKSLLGVDLINLALPSVGATYVHESTVTALSENRYDLVLIMWPDAWLRTEWRVRDPIALGESKNTSLYMSTIAENVCKDSYELIQKDWIFGNEHLQDSRFEYIPVEQRSQISDAFSDFYRLVSNDQLMTHSIIKIISLQGVLKSLGMPYVFMYSKPPPHLPRIKKLLELIDSDQIYNDVYIRKYCTDNGWLSKEFVDYPSITGSQNYALLVKQYLEKRGYV